MDIRVSPIKHVRPIAEQMLHSGLLPKPIKLILHQDQSPGDIVVFTAAIRDLHLNFPGWFLTDVRTPCPGIFENNPYITKIDDNDKNVKHVNAVYNLIHTSNEGCHHFIHGFIKHLGDVLGVIIEPTKLKGDIYISDLEKSWISQVKETVGKDTDYWVINAGSKSDFTCKQWSFERYREVVKEISNITFVQVGHKDHRHPDLGGLSNVINLVGKTDLRQLIRLIYHSCGVITPVSLHMHLAAAIEMRPEYNRRTRPCVVIAGGREPSIWEAYTNHAFLHTCGMLRCCDNGGCWKARVEPLGDGDKKDNKENLCVDPVVTKSGQKVPKCMDLISSSMIVDLIRRYE